MANVILQPASNVKAKDNLKRSIDNPVPIEEIRDLLSKADRSALELLGERDSVSLWGAKAGDRGYGVDRWERLAPGDTIVFGLGKGRIALARVTYKLHNAPLSRHLWGDTLTSLGKVQTWEYMFAVDRVERRQIDIEQFNIAAGRKPNANMQEFIVLKPEASAGALAFLDVPASAASPSRPVTLPRRRSPGARNASSRARRLALLAALQSLDQHVEAGTRAEQSLLREFLLTDDTGNCAMCERTFPIQFLVAAHIKPRSKCSDEERLDFEHVAMPACRFGCDELFERGLISVDAAGVVAVSPRAPEVGPVRAYIAEFLEARAVGYWSAREQSREYFAYHFRTRFQSAA